MAVYETGTATGPSDLLTKLLTFAAANGWTVNTPTVTKSGTYSQSSTTGIITVTITAHGFSVGEVVGADFTSGIGVDGTYTILTSSANTFTIQGVATTASGNVTITSTHGKVLTKGGIYFGIAYFGNDIHVAGATGYSATAAWNEQPGASSTQPKSNDMPGPYQAYHFFTGTSPDYLHVVVEKSAGIFKHVVIGQLVKHGTFTGGEYIGAMYWHMTNVNSSNTPNYPDNNYHVTPFDSDCATATAGNRSAVRADIDSKSNNWMVFNNAGAYTGNNAKGVVRGVGTGILESLHERSPSEFNQITPLLPMLICGERPSTMVSPLGYVPDMRYVNMTNFAPGELLTIGSDEWLVFPFIQKTTTWDNTGSTTPSSGTYGFAYKRN